MKKLPSHKKLLNLNEMSFMNKFITVTLIQKTQFQELTIILKYSRKEIVGYKRSLLQLIKKIHLSLEHWKKCTKQYLFRSSLWVTKILRVNITRSFFRCETLLLKRKSQAFSTNVFWEITMMLLTSFWIIWFLDEKNNH